jgi:hypothetical protein
MDATKPMRVLCINGQSDRAETRSFIEMHRMGIDITVLTYPGTAQYEALIAADVPTIPYKLKCKISPTCIRLIRKELKKKRYDVLHMLDKRATMNGLFASIGMDIKLVAYRGIIGNISYWSPQSWLYLLNPRLDRIICVCEAIRQYFLNLGMPGMRLRREHPYVWFPESYALDIEGCRRLRFAFVETRRTPASHARSDDCRRCADSDEFRG